MFGAKMPDFLLQELRTRTTPYFWKKNVVENGKTAYYRFFKIRTTTYFCKKKCSRKFSTTKSRFSTTKFFSIHKLEILILLLLLYVWDINLSVQGKNVFDFAMWVRISWIFFSHFNKNSYWYSWTVYFSSIYNFF